MPRRRTALGTYARSDKIDAARAAWQQGMPLYEIARKLKPLSPFAKGGRLNKRIKASWPVEPARVIDADKRVPSR